MRLTNRGFLNMLILDLQDFSQFSYYYQFCIAQKIQ